VIQVDRLWMSAGVLYCQTPATPLIRRLTAFIAATFSESASPSPRDALAFDSSVVKVDLGCGSGDSKQLCRNG
jgi:hypothetical protein